MGPRAKTWSGGLKNAPSTNKPLTAAGRGKFFQRFCWRSLFRVNQLLQGKRPQKEIQALDLLDACKNGQRGEERRLGCLLDWG